MFCSDQELGYWNDTVPVLKVLFPEKLKASTNAIITTRITNAGSKY
jgi:hypothetical protein